MKQARKLSEEERRELALDLLDSALAPEIESSWREEARRRIAEIDSGEVATLSNEEALRFVSTDD